MKITELVTRFIARHKILWNLFYPLTKFSNGILFQKQLFQDEPYLIEIMGVLENPIVLNGPFKGLIYPNFKSFGSAIFPKILGSYESEITPIWNKIIKINYEYIIDVGAAEGYYSVGLAKIFREKCNVLAVDVNPDALSLLEKIAKLNDVENFIETKLHINSDEIAIKCNGKRNFILSDCEGYENELFSTNNLPSLKLCDLLVEVHDSKVPGTSGFLIELFSKTHNIERIFSVDDFQKTNYYRYHELESLSHPAKFKILAEGRNHIQEWLFIQAKI